MPTKKTTQAEAEPATESSHSVEAEPARELEVLPCANCDQPATHRTLISAANVTHYCEQCAERTYPGLTMVEPL